MLEQAPSLIELAAERAQFAKRGQDHCYLRAALVQSESEFEGALERLLRPLPSAYEHEVNSQVVIPHGGIQLVFRALVIPDGFLKIADAVVRAAQQRAHATHVSVDLSK